MITAVILCGGSGTRLWPASRKAFPKQFVRLTGAASSFQDTLRRVTNLKGFTAPLIITGAAYEKSVREQIAEAGLDGQILIEPEGRDSGPAIAAAAAYLLASDPDATLVVMASDHHIGDLRAFETTIPKAVAAAEAGHIVTFGIKPDHPATGYGYIQPGEAIGGLGDVRRVASFAEKPEAAVARDYLAAGYLWNSGNFVFRADVFLRELAAFEPAMLDAVSRSVASGSATPGGFLLQHESFREAVKKPVDYAVMERTRHAVVLPAEMGWSDIGTWDAVWEIAGKDAAGNAVSGDAIVVDTERSLVRADGILVATIGVQDLVIVATPDAVLVCARDRSQSVREVVDRLAAAGRAEATEPPADPATRRPPRA